MIGGTRPGLAYWSDMNNANVIPETPVVGPPPVVVDPVAPAMPKPDPKPSPEGTPEFWTHVIR
jgi:hypothetical protein